MSDLTEALARMGADVRSTDGARRVAHDRLLEAIDGERPGVRSDARARRRSRVLPAATIVCALMLAVALLALVRPGEVRPPAPATSAAATRAALEKSRRLIAAPSLPTRLSPGTPRLTDRTADALARRLALTLPYPPGVRDDLRPIFSQARPEMARVTQAADGESVAQYRVWCSWMRYWLERTATGDTTGVRAARQVLSDAARWPAFRNSGRMQRQISDAVRSDESDTVADQVQLNCQGVP